MLTHENSSRLHWNKYSPIHCATFSRIFVMISVINSFAILHPADCSILDRTQKKFQISASQGQSRNYDKRETDS
jgi:hypothetical protein